MKVEYYSTSLDKYFMECNQFETTVGNILGDTNYDGIITFKDTMNIIKANVDNEDCYNGDINGDAKLSILDIYHSINQNIK